MKLIAFLLLILMSSTSSAEFYKCQVNGKIQFSSHPCADVSSQDILKIKDKRPIDNLPIAVPNRISHKQNEDFEFDGLLWKIKSAYEFSQIGNKDYPQTPKNNRFIIVEMDIKNISQLAKYPTNSTVIISGNKQFQESHMGSFAEENMGYSDGSSIKIEPGITIKAFKIFDAEYSPNYKLIMRQLMSDYSAEVNINWVSSK